MALLNVLLSSIVLAILVGFTVTVKSKSTSAPTTSPIPGIPETVLNPYCNFSVDQLLNKTYQHVNVSCANSDSSTLDDNYESGFFPINYLQADNGSMSRAIEDALKQIKQRIPKKELSVNMEVNGYHPRSHARRYLEIVAVIDISNKLTASLGTHDSVSIRIQHAGMRFDPENKADHRIKLFAPVGVVLLNWDYLAGTRPIVFFSDKERH